jgi:hypothetical protein
MACSYTKILQKIYERIGDRILIDQSGTRTSRAGVLFNLDEQGGEKQSHHDFLYIVNSRPFFPAAPSIFRPSDRGFHIEPTSVHSFFL